MNRYPNPEALTAYWQHSLEIGSEAGQRAVIGLGLESVQAEQVLVLLALRRLAHRPVGLADPVILVGGEGDLWLLSAMQWHRRPPALSRAGQLNLVFAGSDVATYAAIANISAPSGAPPGGPLLPPGMAWALTPTALPGSERSDLSYLPFVLADDLFVPSVVPPVPSTWLDRVEVWATIVLVLGLLLAAWLR